MSSFDKMSAWPVGHFRAITSWLLRNRKEVAARVSSIEAEIARIGFIQVSYKTDAAGKKTEERTGISVSPNSSLGKLLQAYIAVGGNPYDISPFMYPDGTSVSVDQESGEMTSVYTYPHGGIVSPMSSEPNERQKVEIKPPDGYPGGSYPIDSGFGPYKGGWMNTDRYYPARQGGRVDRGSYDADTVVRGMHQIRSWANQEIKERLQNIEWMIIKLCDLREQLFHERDEILVQAFGGALDGPPSPAEGRFDPNRMVQVMIQDMYALIYQTDGSGLVAGFRPSPIVPLLGFTFKDEDSEASRMAMGC